MGAIEIKDVYITRGKKKLFENFSLAIEHKSVTAMIAPSGSGKTTLLSLIAGIVPQNCETLSGHVSCSSASMIFQEPRLLPQVSVLGNITIPLLNLMPPEKAGERAARFLSCVSLSEKSGTLPHELSGGERQRVSVARAFAFPSEIILMDEPFQFQDLRIKTKLISTIKKLLEHEKRTVLFVTHDAEEAVSLAQRIVVLDGSPLSVKLDSENSGDTLALTNKIKSILLQN